MKSSWILYVSLVFCLSFSACTGQSQQKTTESAATDAVQATVHRVGVEAFKTQLEASESVQLVDVRTPEEFEAGHIAKAVNYNINGAAFQQQVEGLDKSQPVLVYCKMGGRSAKAAGVLKELGFSTIYDLEGGYTAWAAQ